MVQARENRLVLYVNSKSLSRQRQHKVGLLEFWRLTFHDDEDARRRLERLELVTDRVPKTRFLAMYPLESPQKMDCLRQFEQGFS